MNSKRNTISGRKNNIRRVILSCIGVAGLITMAVLAPNALQLLQIFEAGKKKNNTKYYINTVIDRLINEKLIKLEQNGEVRYFTLTKEGERRLAKYQLIDFSDKVFPKWDGKWRVVVFDVKECSRGARDDLRYELTNAGFVRLQNSVWIFPYECEEFVFLLKTSCELGKNVIFMTVDKLENDAWLRRKFGLL